MAGSVGHAEKPAPGAAKHVDFFETEMRAQRFQIVDLVGERAGLPGLERSGVAIAALIVEDDAPVFRERIPRRRSVQVGVIEAGTAIDQQERSFVAAANHFVVELPARAIKELAFFVARWMSVRRGTGDKECRQDHGRKNGRSGACTLRRAGSVHDLVAASTAYPMKLNLCGSILYKTRVSPGCRKGYVSLPRYFFARLSICSSAPFWVISTTLPRISR